uniref:Protein kinase domain-containing protein n=1 Tax=Panagrolaimus sp. ES5 TaxID=591445 RepID=A0AC34FYC3_9BILA
MEATSCIIFNDKISCHKSCRTCADNSYCGNPNACKSCHPGEYKLSSNYGDEIFACSKICEHFSFKLTDYFFCDAKKSLRATTRENFNVKNFVKNNASSDVFCFKFVTLSCIGAASTVGIGAYCIILCKQRTQKAITIKAAADAVNIELGLINANQNNIHKELHVYDKVSHPNILPAYGVHFGIDNMLFLALRKFNLKDYFVDYGKNLDFIQLKQYCIQVADGMKYLHIKKILHCDLKVENILVKDEKGEHVEIADFGSAVDLEEDHEISMIGTKTHMAYELLKKSSNANFTATASKASDVWSYAVTVWQIFQKTDELPSDFKTPKNIITNLENGKKLPTPSIVSERFWRQIIIRCFDLDPLARPSMDYLHKSLLNEF